MPYLYGPITTPNQKLKLAQSITYYNYVVSCYLTIYYILVNEIVCIIKNCLCHDKANYIISYHVVFYVTNII